MTFESYIAIWLISIFCGGLLGSARGQFVSGLVWTLLFGPLGIIVVLCLPDRKKQAAERARAASLNEQLILQRAQLDELRKLFSTPPATIRIARGDQDLGEISMDEVKSMLSEGSLTPQDYFLDPITEQWLPIDSHPHLK